jgi:hypothetical protein
MKTRILLFAVLTFLCFVSILSNGQAPNWTWAKSAGGHGNDGGVGIEADKAGNVFVNGGFKSATITFGTYTLNNAGDGDEDMFIVKYNEAGDVAWAKSSGASGTDYGTGICPDASDNVFLGGGFYGPSITFGSTTLTNANNNGNSQDMFFVKYNGNGDVLWANSYGGIYYDAINYINKNSSEYIYITGDFYSPAITFGSDILTNTSNTGATADFFLAKCDTNGNVLWAKSASGTGEDWGNEVCVDASGNTYLEGEFNSPTITFGSTTLTNADNTGNTFDSFLVKYDANGNVIWAKSVNGNGNDETWTIGIDISEDFYIAGNFDSPTLNFGSITLTNTGQSDIFIAKYNANGNVLWAKSAGGTLNDGISHLNVDIAGNVVLLGVFKSPSITFGATTLTNADNTGNTNDTFIVQYDANGNVNWAKSFGGIGNDMGWDCTVDKFGNVFISGIFNSPTLSFGSTTLTNADNTGSTNDMFVAKLGNYNGIKELSNRLNMSVFPNPAAERVTIETSAISTQSQISIMNANGQQLITCKTSGPKTQIDISKLPGGVYFVRLTNNKTVEMGKFIKQ